MPGGCLFYAGTTYWLHTALPGYLPGGYIRYWQAPSLPPALHTCLLCLPQKTLLCTRARLSLPGGRGDVVTFPQLIGEWVGVDGA